MSGGWGFAAAHEYIMNYFDTDAKVGIMDGPDIRHVFYIRYPAGYVSQYSAYWISKAGYPVRYLAW